MKTRESVSSPRDLFRSVSKCSMRSVVDELITLGKKGDLAARRQAAAFIRDVVADEKTQQTVLQKLFDEVAPKYADRKGGYTRVVKTGVRRGDAAPMAYIELV